MEWVQRHQKKIPNKDDLLIEQVADIRGINDIERFLNPTESELIQPLLIKNIEEVGMKILESARDGDNILLSYDADADGITSTSVMYRYLKEYTDNVDYIYNERNHGHGIHEQTRLDFISEEDVNDEGYIVNEDKEKRYNLNKSNLEKISKSDLLIIIDSSSNDVDACKKLVDDYGIEIIIIDHHSVEEDNPYVLMVNPQQHGDEYPNKSLSGAGVVFKVIQVMEDILGDEGRVDPFHYMDLIAVGMYADVMRMDSYENRYMVMHGLRNVRNVGLTRILKGAKADLYKLNGDSIGFSVAPLLNAVARLDNIKLAIDIMLTDDDTVAKKLRLQMHKLNEKRKVMQKEIADNYAENIDTSQKILMVMDDNSSKGFNGLISQQLAQRYKRPALVGRLHNGVYSGSFRVYGKIDLQEFLLGSGLVDESKGHPQAGGFVIQEENIEGLIEYVEENLPDLSQEGEYVMYDIELDASEIDEGAIRMFEQLNLVTGNGFPKVVAKVNNIMIDSVDTIGKTMETRKFKTLGSLELIKFKVSEEYASELSIYDNIDVIGDVSMNEWFNFKTREKISTPQVKLLDYKIN